MSLPEPADQATQQYAEATITHQGPHAADPAITLPGYEVLRVLGRGGMGVVYLARHEKLNRVVALKMLLRGADADRDEVARFQTEAEAVARLAHPNIVQIFEVGEHEGRAYFALEYVAGGTLAERLRGTPLPAREAAQLVAELANAMQYAHERNLLHRDLKPANILLADALTPRITDFGLAKRIDADEGRTRTGAVMGTPAYMAPEQAWGQSNKVGPRVDVYALGAILYECLTGRPPFQGATVLETLDQVRTREPVPPRVLNPSVPRDLETICLKCLAKEPAGRYLTARDLALDLRRFLDGEPVTARPLGWAGRGWRAARKRPVLALGLAALALALTLGVVAWLYQTTETARQQEAALRREAEHALERAEQGERRAAELAQRLDRVLTVQRVQGAVREWQQNGLPRARELLDEVAAEHRAWEWHYADRLLSAGTPIPGVFGRIDGLAVLPDGSGVVSAGTQDGLRVWHLADGTERFYLEGTQPQGEPGGGAGMVGGSPVGFALLPERGEVVATATEGGPLEVWSLATGKKVRTLPDTTRVPKTRLAASPDERWLAYSFGGSALRAGPRPPVFVVDPVTGKELATFREHTSDVLALAARADGKALVTGGARGDLCTWDMETFQVGTKVQVVGSFVGLAFSPRGDAVYAAFADGTLQAWSPPEFKIRFRVAHGQPFASLALRPDGAQLACGTASGEIHLFDPVRGQRRGILRGHVEPVTALCYSTDGKVLVSGANDRALRVWDPHQSPEVERRALALPVSNRLALAPGGGTLLAAAGGGLRAWELPAGRPLPAVLTGTEQLLALGVARRQSRVALGAANAPWRVWDWRSGQSFAGPPWSADVVTALALDATGERLYAAGRAAEGVFLRAFDVASGRAPFALPPTGAEVHSLEVSPDGTLLAAVDVKNLLRVWTLPEGREVFRYPAAIAARERLRFSDDGQLLAAAAASGPRVWRTHDWREVLRGRTPFQPRQLTFSPDGSRLACMSAAVTVWDLTTGLEALTLPGSGSVEALAFSADGRTLVGADTDGSLYLWQGTPR